MFKELKVIKLIIILGLFIAILTNLNIAELAINHLFTNKISYLVDDSIKLYTNTHSYFSFEKDLKVTNLNDKELATLTSYIESIDKNSPEQILTFGFDSNKGYNNKVNDNLSAGIYKIEKRYPLIIKSNNESDITVVYPFINNLVYTPENNVSVFDSKIYKTSLKRSSDIDDYTLGLKSMFNYIDSNYKVNYIADLDIEQKDLNKSKLLIFYGKSTFWTAKMKDNLTEFIKKGGNVLFLTTYTLNNYCAYNANDNSIYFNENKTGVIKSWQTHNNFRPIYLIGCSYVFGGKSNKPNYNILNKQHAIFEGVNKLEFNSYLYSSLPVKWDNEMPIVDTAKINLYKTDILAYNTSVLADGEKGVKGIFEIQPYKNSGKILHLGTQDWCLAYDNNVSVKKITHNSINYLLNSSSK